MVEGQEEVRQAFQSLVNLQCLEGIVCDEENHVKVVNAIQNRIFQQYLAGVVVVLGNDLPRKDFEMQIVLLEGLLMC